MDGVDFGTSPKTLLPCIAVSITLVIFAFAIQSDAQFINTFGRSSQRLEESLSLSSPVVQQRSKGRSKQHPPKQSKSKSKPKQRRNNNQPARNPPAIKPAKQPSPAPIHIPVDHHPTPSQPDSPRVNRVSNILHSILNPRAAAYEYRARYYNPLPDPTSHSDSTVPSQLNQEPLPAHSHAFANPEPSSTSKQPYDAFLVLDVEATCMQGSGFDYPNEIIEWPVVLMRWSDKDETGRASQLVIVDEFRSYVRPTWRPQLSEFCTSLTGITQDDINNAPTFPEVLSQFEGFLQKHNLIPPPTALLTPPASRCSSPAPTEPDSTATSSEPPSTSPSPLFSPVMSTSSLYSPPPSFSALANPSIIATTEFHGYQDSPASDYDPGYNTPRFAWATDGPFDLRDFLVKQCFISQIPIPEYFLGDVIDVRRVVSDWVAQGGDSTAVMGTSPSPVVAPVASPVSPPVKPTHPGRAIGHRRVQSLNISSQLKALSLGSFSGRQHSGIDDARNISRILQALAVRAVRLEGNTYVNPNRKWYWMGRDGVVLPPELFST
ncbi:hypothetical protein FRC02_010874 [Tulasnella sp. 418]|nr:hypothetical protein FRC02_010874 [Tulasnella sp. 418]